MIWREKRTLLIILGVLLLSNVVFFFTYRVQYQSRLDAMDERLAQVEGQLQTARRARLTAEQSLQSYKKVQGDVQQILDETWSTRPRRLTALISEVKRLAVASNAVPKSISFSRSELQNQPATKTIGAQEVGIGFSVDASYDQARRMINLLELSRQFVIIDQITLAAGTEDKLTLSLHLKTLFRDEQPGVASDRL